MASTIPPGFVDIYTASQQRNKDHNIMGVVTDILPPTLSRGTDWMFTFSISDSTSGYGDGQKMRFFKRSENDCPKVQGIGDVILLRAVKFNDWSGMAIGVSNYGTTWTVFPSSSIPQSPPSNNPTLPYIKETRAPNPLPAEMLYAIRLCNSKDRGTFKPLIAPSHDSSLVASKGSLISNSTRRDKFSLIKDVAIDTFYDLVGQVVKIYPSMSRVELSITDYTQNSLLYNYEWGRNGADGGSREGDTYGYTSCTTSKKWQGPYGKRTLMIALWPPHSYYAQSHVKEDDFVHLRNVHIKYSRDTNYAKVEGALHTDRRDQDRVDVTIVKSHNDDRVKDILRRKREYQKQFKHESEAFVEEARGVKRKLGEDGKEKLSKNQLRKKRKQEREQAQQQESKRKDTDRGHQETGTSPLRTAKPDLNKNIRTTNPQKPALSIPSILDTSSTHAYTTPAGNALVLPFQNTRFRTTARVIDFYPPDLADFAVRHRESEFDVLSSDGSGSDSDSNDSIDSSRTTSSHPGSDPEHGGSQTSSRARVGWQWRFCLLLEDASSTPVAKGQRKERMRVFVAGEDAECLLKMDAMNLRRRPQALAQLREKLFLLWGDLEERKSREQDGKLKEKAMNVGAGKGRATADQDMHTKPQGRSFQCCIKEYGVRVKGGNGRQGWERRFKIFGTTIV